MLLCDVFDASSAAILRTSVGQPGHFALGRELESDRDYGGLSLKHIQESNQQAVAQLNHQVDFLNAQCAELQAEVEATRGSYALAEQRQARNSAQFGSIYIGAVV